MAVQPMNGRSAGTGLAIIVNANAKRGGRRVAAQIARALPGARVRLTKTIEEISGWLTTLRDPKCILAAGGDGSAIALVNALNRVTPPRGPLPPYRSAPARDGKRLGPRHRRTEAGRFAPSTEQSPGHAPDAGLRPRGLRRDAHPFRRLRVGRANLGRLQDPAQSVEGAGLPGKQERLRIRGRDAVSRRRRRQSSSVVRT